MRATPMIPAADLELTEQDIAYARAAFADCSDLWALRMELSVSTVRVHALTAALTSGDMQAAAAAIRAMRAARRVFEELAAALPNGRTGDAR
ncbi:hypothetical protein [Frankia sp. AvcI1]|uniref:hypothetical protein n=1 Tax=Frankia sp. AvcI1 TaxID=573496 RepID=UPI000A7DBC18|nr:hypothetical protein [Frankia sp. AvcI1]